MSFEDLFVNPPMAHRLAPFWFWNGDMNAEEITHQIREMARQGVGGFFISARQGLEIPYLSDEWFQRVAVAIDAAQQYGMSAWLYDEYPYPSGMSGGEVTLLHPEAKHRTLQHQVITATGPQTLTQELPWAKVLSAQAVPLAETGNALSWSQALDIASSIGIAPAAAVFQSTGLTSYTNKRFFSADLQKQLVWNVPPGRWQIHLFLEKEIEDFKYYGTYVDPCHEAAMRTFIETTHEQYARRFRQHFGKTIPGFFTDEVGLMGKLPWSPRLPDFFREQYGADLVASLPELLYPTGTQTAQLRYRYFQSVYQLLGKSYHEPMGQWCEQHGLQYLTEVPSARMTTQRYSHIPGGDSAHEKVGRSLEWILDRYALSLRANPKIASSLAHQYGHDWSMIECFHSVGWTMTLQDAKLMLDRLAAFGINLYIFHAFYYSIDGLRKHDAAPSQFLQNPYWEHFRQLADYAARLSYALSQGQVHAPIAVVHPITSFWTHLGNPFHNFHYAGEDPVEEQALERLKADWAALDKQLLFQHVDYDHLDPETLAQASIEDGQIVSGYARYKVLILPPMSNLEAAAWSKVQAFLRAGGVVISLGLLPYEQIDAQQDIEVEAAYTFGLTTSPRQHYWQGARDEGARPAKGTHAAYFIAGSPQDEHSIDQLLAILQQHVPPTCVIEPLVGNGRSLLTHQRDLPDGSHLLFIVQQENAELTVRVQGPHCQSVERLDLTSGQIVALPFEQRTDGSSVTLSFAPYEAHLLRFAAQHSAHQAAPSVQEEAYQLSIDLQGEWALTAQQENSLRLGTFGFSLSNAADGDEGMQEWPLVEAKTLVNQFADLAKEQRLPMQFKQTFGVSPTVSLAYPLQCWYRTSFLVEEIPPACQLVMDVYAIGGKYTLSLNGEEIAAQDAGATMRFGHPQRAYNVRHLLKQGHNTLLIQVEAERDWHGICDPLYLSGPFGVGVDAVGKPTITKLPTMGIPRSDPQPGYPYYAGTLNFTREFVLDEVPHSKTFVLTFQNWDSYLRDSIAVLINGQTLGAACWSPYRWSGESTLLRTGSNTIELRLTNTLGALLDGTRFDERSHKIVNVL